MRYRAARRRPLRPRRTLQNPHYRQLALVRGDHRPHGSASRPSRHRPDQHKTVPPSKEQTEGPGGVPANPYDSRATVTPRPEIEVQKPASLHASGSGYLNPLKIRAKRRRWMWTRYSGRIRSSASNSLFEPPRWRQRLGAWRPKSPVLLPSEGAPSSTCTGSISTGRFRTERAHQSFVGVPVPSLPTGGTGRFGELPRAHDRRGFRLDGYRADRRNKAAYVVAAEAWAADPETIVTWRKQMNRWISGLREYADTFLASLAAQAGTGDLVQRGDRRTDRCCLALVGWPSLCGFRCFGMILS